MKNGKKPKSTGTAEIRDYHIKSVFYSDYSARTVVRKNTACHSESAALRCADHMRHDKYGAVLAEVYDEVSGKLHSVVKRNRTGRQVVILYSSTKPKED